MKTIGEKWCYLQEVLLTAGGDVSFAGLAENSLLKI